jgi:phosphoribosylformimino-5-aminoimidazole carboxamide ribotide isomerase
MKIIPAIDIKGGRCVRLFQGRMDQETVYSDDPVSVARRWRAAGAQLIHVVDLDGAVAGRPVHFDIIREIALAAGVSVQVGGGIRSVEEVARYLDAGLSRVVLGSVVVQDEAMAREAGRRFPGKVAAGIDAKEGWVAVRGWEETTKVRAVDLVQRIGDYGFGALIFTDIRRDGTLLGPNLAALRTICRVSGIPVIASGGVSGLQDLQSLLPLTKDGLEGVIVGKALYAGTLDLAESISAVGG